MIEEIDDDTKLKKLLHQVKFCSILEAKGKSRSVISVSEAFPFCPVLFLQFSLHGLTPLFSARSEALTRVKESEQLQFPTLSP